VTVDLYGYRYSVYSWIARAVLHQKGCDYGWVEINPFGDVPSSYLAVHPFARVPALRHGAITIFETVAITRYIDEAFSGPALQPDTPLHRARLQQIIAAADSYAYWPLVRQVFSHGVFRPALALDADAAELRRGLDASPRVLSAFEQLISGDTFLVPGDMTLADLHLAPMLIYFAMVPAGANAVSACPKLSRWLELMRTQAALSETRPILPF
jgi:glutathione S-transferase